MRRAVTWRHPELLQQFVGALGFGHELNFLESAATGTNRGISQAHQKATHARRVKWLGNDTILPFGVVTLLALDLLDLLGTLGFRASLSP